MFWDLVNVWFINGLYGRLNRERISIGWRIVKIFSRGKKNVPIMGKRLTNNKQQYKSKHQKRHISPP
jgi:hypothetical protein